MLTDFNKLKWHTKISCFINKDSVLSKGFNQDLNSVVKLMVEILEENWEGKKLFIEYRENYINIKKINYYDEEKEYFAPVHLTINWNCQGYAFPIIITRNYEVPEKKLCFNLDDFGNYLLYFLFLT